jgi:hypothetical protein
VYDWFGLYIRVDLWQNIKQANTRVGRSAESKKFLEELIEPIPWNFKALNTSLRLVFLCPPR